MPEPIKQLIEAEPSFGYRTVAALLGMNKNTVQRVFNSKAGRFASAQWVADRAFKQCYLKPKSRISVGLLICVGFGVVKMVG